MGLVSAEGVASALIRFARDNPDGLQPYEVRWLSVDLDRDAPRLCLRLTTTAGRGRRCTRSMRRIYDGVQAGPTATDAGRDAGVLSCD
jgi:hypothetical protein